MPERIYKLQPDRTVSLRGFDTFAAAATIHSASANGFKVSGTFRDPADFAVAVLYDADNFYEHPRLKYLPDFDFAGLVLSFNLHYSDGLQPIDSPKYNWIDWATLDCIRADGSVAKVRLWDHSRLVDSVFPAANATVTVTTDSRVRGYDRLTLWFQNLAFDYVVPGENPRSTEFQFYAGATGTVHTVTINGRTYSHTEAAGENSAAQAEALIAAINLAEDPDVAAASGATSNAVVLTVRDGREGMAIPITASGSNAPVSLYASSPALAAAGLAAQINVADWVTANSTHALIATSSGAQITITAACYGTADVSGTSVTLTGGTRFSGFKMGSFLRMGGSVYTVASVESPTHLTLTTAAPAGTGIPWAAPRGGRDGNMIRLCALTSGPSLTLDQTDIQLSGGSSDVTWNCTLDFTALGIDQLRQCWLTFAPALTNGTPYTTSEWEATFSNWTVTGPEEIRALQVAGPGSIRIDQSSQDCLYQGTWNLESGFYSDYFARATSDPAASLNITYNCQFEHDLYIGTSLYTDRAVARVQLDDDTVTPFDCRMNTGSAVVTRRRIRAAVGPGEHTVSITFAAEDPGVFYFDFLEAAVRTDIPDPLPARPKISPAIDFDTDHTYKLPPARLMWIFDQLGYAGPINEYLGVFWWNERTPVGGSVSRAAINFSGSFISGDTVTVTVNGTQLKKDVFPADTPATIATHFAAWVNATFVGVWASLEPGRLILTSRSPAPAYNLTVSVAATSAAGLAALTEPPVPGVYPSWVIDPAAAEPLNRATRDWHADYYSLGAERGREVVTACSLELVNPPDDFRARFADTARTHVATATGFGSLVSDHCAVGNAAYIAFQKKVYRSIARLQTAAGLIPSVQYGEFVYWFFPNAGGGMAFYDDETLAAAEVALGRPLHRFQLPHDDPSVNGYADAVFLRDRLRDHLAALTADIRAAYPAVRCELLWPYDVNYPVPVPGESPYLGGQLNRFVNLPVEWETPGTSGFDTLKVEALAFATGMRNLNLAREAVALFPAFGWPRSAIRYLVPVFGSATPWHRELDMVWAEGIPYANLWAFDHVCLFNLDVPEKALDRRSTVRAA